MIEPIQNLPTEPAVLQKIVVDLMTKNNGLSSKICNLTEANQNLNATNKNLNATNKDLQIEVEFLREKLKLLRAKKFGKSSEKTERQLEMLELQVEEGEETGSVAIEEDEAGKPHNKNKPKRQKLPSHLPRTDIVLNIDGICPDCGGEEFRKISEDISETLEYVPASFRVNRYIRPRCACVNCEKVVQAYAPSKAIDKGKAGAGLLAHIIVQKYCNHLPLYRQSQMYEREGVEISRSTLASWVGQSAKLLEPIIEGIREEVFSAKYVHGDDTPIKVLAPGAGKTKTGRLWTYVKDGRPHGDNIAPAVCYYYSPDRKGERPLEHLKDYKGVLHADAYSGYDELYIDKGRPEDNITEAACWAHTRRKFYEITVVNDKANIAMEVIEEIGKIYGIEEKIRGLPPERRLEERQRVSKDLVIKLFNRLKKYEGELPKKSTTALAIGYALRHKEALMRYLSDGQIEIDNNAAERAMRTIAVGRKNWLFAGSDIGGSSAATMYTLIETAKLNSLNPFEYLRQVLERIQDHPYSKIADLLPWNIKLD